MKVLAKFVRSLDAGAIDERRHLTHLHGAAHRTARAVDDDVDRRAHVLRERAHGGQTGPLQNQRRRSSW